MPEIISVTEAARNFSDVINRVYYQGQSYLLTRGGTVVAQLSAVGAPLTGAEWRKRWQDSALSCRNYDRPEPPGAA